MRQTGWCGKRRQKGVATGPGFLQTGWCGKRRQNGIATGPATFRHLGLLGKRRQKFEMNGFLALPSGLMGLLTFPSGLMGLLTFPSGLMGLLTLPSGLRAARST